MAVSDYPWIPTVTLELFKDIERVLPEAVDWENARKRIERVWLEGAWENETYREFHNLKEVEGTVWLFLWPEELKRRASVDTTSPPTP